MNARILLDENIPYALIEFLERRGHTVYHIRKLGKAGIRNGEVYQLAVELRAWIVTRDKDFKSYVKFASYDVPGVIVIETDEQLTRTQVVNTFRGFLDKFEEKLTEKRLICIEENEVRIIDAE
jgi:predicted nuclease of predicted toxin-antitoxin system